MSSNSIVTNPSNKILVIENIFWGASPKIVLLYSSKLSKKRRSEVLTLNYDKVKCVADIDLSTLEGKGYLVPVSDEEYVKIMGKEDDAS